MQQMGFECRTAGCPAAGIQKRIFLKLVALDVVEVPNLMCTRCRAQMFRCAETEAVEVEVEVVEVPKPARRKAS